MQDNYGVWSNPANCTFVVNGRPQAQITGPDDDTVFIFGESVQFSSTASDDQNSTTYYWNSDVDGQLYSGSSSSFSINNLTRGEHEITFYVSDMYGYNSTERLLDIRINHEPTINLTGPEPGVWVPDLEDGKVTFWWDASDDDGDDLEFTLYIGESADEMSILGNTTLSKEVSYGFDTNINYYWKIVVNDGYQSFNSRLATLPYSLLGPIGARSFIQELFQLQFQRMENI